jgi:hypothetical protein
MIIDDESEYAESEENQDFRKLTSVILRGAIDDYVRLQHPQTRKRSYELEAFWSACDLIFDDETRLGILDPEGEEMSLLELAKAASGRERVDLENLREHAVKEALKYWENKDLKMFEIPTDLCAFGHVYRIEQSSLSSIDFDEKIIFIDKQSKKAIESFFILLLEIACHHAEIKSSAKQRKDMALALYSIFKINDCFNPQEVI